MLVPCQRQSKYRLHTRQNGRGAVRHWTPRNPTARRTGDVLSVPTRLTWPVTGFSVRLGPTGHGQRGQQ